MRTNINQVRIAGVLDQEKVAGTVQGETGSDSGLRPGCVRVQRIAGAARSMSLEVGRV